MTDRTYIRFLSLIGSVSHFLNVIYAIISFSLDFAYLKPLWLLYILAHNDLFSHLFLCVFYPDFMILAMSSMTVL